MKRYRISTEYNGQQRPTRMVLNAKNEKEARKKAEAQLSKGEKIVKIIEIESMF